MKKKLLLIAALCAIAAAIWYIEGTKAGPAAAPHSQSVALENAAEIAATTTAQNSAPQETIAGVLAADRKTGYSPAVEIADPTGFINAAPFKLKDLIGKKVILLDFWTYSCINCIRTLPYLTSWYAKYKDKGLEIVGVHTPEFEFEKDMGNVKAATEKYGIKYPVVLDSNYGTWTAYGNRYWPHEYLIDMAGYIVHDQVGEGNYDETEKEIQKLIAERADVLGLAEATTTMPLTPQGEATYPLSPETYFGSARNEFLANGRQGSDGTQMFSAPASFEPNALYLDGSWKFVPEYAANNSGGAKIIYKYQAKRVYFVASSPYPVTVEVLRDGVPLSADLSGADVKNGKVTIKESRLYDLVNDPAAGEHTLELIIESPGLQAYTFTFG